MGREWLVDVPVGARVVVRYLIEDGARATDALGTLAERDEQHLVVDTARAGRVRISLADVVAAKPVPPAPAPRRRRAQTSPGPLAIVGAGRLGTAFAAAFRAAGRQVEGPLGRGSDGAGADIVLLTVPDRSIAEAADALAPRPGLLVGHCSGATTLEPLAGHEAFSLHPLMTIPESGARFVGVTAAVAGSTPRALATATDLATSLGMRAVQVRDEDRAAYHAAAAVASNFLTTLLDLAEHLAAVAGLDREQLEPIVLAAVQNWSRDGGPAALTGPVARGDDATVARHREAVAQHRPQNVELFDALVTATRLLAGREVPTGQASPALARSGQAEQDLYDQIDEEFGMLSSAAAGERLGSRSSATGNLALATRREGRLLAVQRGRHLVFPGFQFDEHGARPVIADVIALGQRHNRSESGLVQWLVSATTYLGGRRPVDVLDEPGLLKEVAEAAFGVEW